MNASLHLSVALDNIYFYLLIEIWHEMFSNQSSECHAQQWRGKIIIVRLIESTRDCLVAHVVMRTSKSTWKLSEPEVQYYTNFPYKTSRVRDESLSVVLDREAFDKTQQWKLFFVSNIKEFLLNLETFVTRISEEFC